MKILITGGRSQIAMALAERQAKLGNEILVTASSPESCAKVERAYADAEISARVLLYPLAPQLPLDSALEACLEDGIDALILNASPPIKRFRLLHQIASEEIRESVALNIEGNLRIVQKALPAMIKAKFGRLVFVSSAMVATGTSRHGLYCMTKAAMEAMFLNLAIDYGRHNILSNVVRPGIVRTERTKRFWKRASYLKKAERLIPQGKLGEPSQIAECFDPILSKTSYMNGAVVTVSGGLPLMNLSESSE